MKWATGSKLTAQQSYLLGRIPSMHQLDGYKETPEPSVVKQARRTLERWDKAEGLRRCKQQKRNEALIRKAREAVYFAPPEKALQIIQQCEKLLKGCPIG